MHRHSNAGKSSGGLSCLKKKFYNFVVEAKITFDIYEAEAMPDIDYLSSQLYDLLSKYTDDVEEVQIIRMEEIKKNEK